MLAKMEVISLKARPLFTSYDFDWVEHFKNS